MLYIRNVYQPSSGGPLDGTGHPLDIGGRTSSGYVSWYVQYPAGHPVYVVTSHCPVDMLFGRYWTCNWTSTGHKSMSSGQKWRKIRSIVHWMSTGCPVCPLDVHWIPKGKMGECKVLKHCDVLDSGRHLRNRLTLVVTEVKAVCNMGEADTDWGPHHLVEANLPSAETNWTDGVK